MSIASRNPWPEQGVIDIHAHFLPQPYRDALKDAGVNQLDGGMPIPHWSASDALALMDKHGVATAVLSVSSPGLTFVEPRHEARLARQINEAAAELLSRHRGRFGAFATLPLSHRDAALREIDYALDVLGLDGFILQSNHYGRYPGHDDFAPVLDALNARKACVFLHPTSPTCLECVSCGRPAPLIEFPFETTRAVVDLIYSGALERAPDIRFVIAHAGGALPFLAQRIAGFTNVVHPSPNGLTPERVQALLRGLYYDTAISANALQLDALLQITPLSHVLFGSDWPFTPEVLLGASLEALHAMPRLDQESVAAILRDNALKLLRPHAE